MVTHLFNGMPGLHHREPGMVGAALSDERVVAGLIADLVHVHPMAIWIAFRAKPGRIALVTDAVAWRGAAIGRIEIVHDGTAPRLPDGTLAGSSLTMDTAIRNVVDVGGVRSRMRWWRHRPRRPRCSASPTAADRAGGAADLVALDPDLQVDGVGSRVRR